MDNDKELLKLAAKAIDFEWFEAFGKDGPSSIRREDWSEAKLWNPLNDDGDAFKLATSLGISVLPYPIYDEPKHSALAVKKRLFPMPEDSAIEIYGDDPCAATRRAIVRIAANLARG